MDIERNTELANKILHNPDPEQKYKGLSNLIESIATELPDAITVEHRDLVLSHHTLRFNDYWSNVYLYGSGVGFRDCVNLITKHRDEVEQWEQDDAATIAMRKDKLKEYAQTFSIQNPPKEIVKFVGRNARTEVIREPHPDRIYCQHGSYRMFDQLKDGYYYRLGRMIQTADPNGDLKKTMQAVCLMVALNNERSIVEDELRLLGITPMAKTETLSKIEYNRLMECNDISELREAASGYLWLLQHYDWGYNEPNNESVTRLHRAIANVDLGEIDNVLAQRNVNQYRIIEELVEPTLTIIGKLEKEIGDNMPRIKRKIDPKVGTVFQFCKDVGKLLRGEYDNLTSRRNTDPTFDDVDAVEKLREFGLGSYGEMAFDDFIKEYIIKGLSHIAVVRRLKYMISQCGDEHTQWGLRKFLYWRKCDEDAVKELHDAFVDFYRFYDHAADVSPIPSDGDRDKVTTRLFSVLEWCKQHELKCRTQMEQYPLIKGIEDLSVLATYICESADTDIWCSVIGNDTVTMDLINDVADILESQIKPTIKQRTLTPTPSQPTPEAQTSPSVQATAKDDAPDFSHMESYTPTIPFDMSALYTFLKDEGVIRDIDEPLFADCIMHANMNEVWKVGNHHKLKCVFRYVKDHFPNNWIDVVAQRMNTTRKKITAFQRDKIRDFERKLRDIV